MELGYGGRLDPKIVTDAVQAALGQRYGEEKWILYNIVNGNIYLNEAAIEKRKLNLEEVEDFARAVVLNLPNIAECLTRAQIGKGQVPHTTIARSIANGFYAPRDGNLVLIPQAYFFFGEGILTTHGSPFRYDTHVPVIFYGSGITPGFYHNESSPADIAPTLATLLKVQPPSNSIGRVLSEAFKATP
jgi:hypothetical protein